MKSRNSVSARKPKVSRSRKRRLRQKQQDALHFEALEPKQLLAGVTVGNALDLVNAPDTSSIAALIANDGGDGISLREAITAANNTGGADTISFDASLSGSTIPLSGTELAITETLTIDASSLNNNVEVDAQQLSRVIHFTSSSGDLSFDGITIKNGLIAARGGGIRFDSSGTLSLDNSLVSGNQTVDAAQDTDGGGIFSPSGNVTLNNSSVTGNQTEVNSSFVANGSGIATNTGNISLTNSFVDNNINQAFYNTGVGVFSNSGSITLSNSSVSGNNSPGGGVTYGGGIATNSGIVSITDSSINNNGSGSAGGGIWVGSSSGQLTIGNSSISGNNAGGSGGGGISSNAPTSITGSSISNNVADGGFFNAGGGIRVNNSLTLTDSTVHDNTAKEGKGGGVFVSGSSLITGSTISNNSVIGYGISNGGGISFSGAGPHLITNSTVSGNSSNEFGGGIFSYVSLTIAHSTVTANTSPLGGGGVYLYGGGILTLENSIVAANTSSVSPDVDIATGTISAHYSLIGDNLGSSLVEAQTTPDANGNWIGSSLGAGTINPLLGALANNGGATNTHLLQVGSRAVNAGDPTAVAGTGNTPQFDQRGTGFDRVLSGRLDMGAFENSVNLPLFTSPTSANVVENTQSVLALTATHSDDPPPTITISLSGTGNDNSKFEIISGDQLQFQSPPDFEAPLDVGGTPGDNVYVVTVQADDGTNVVQQTVLVTVTNVELESFVVDTTIDENDGDFSAGDLSLREAIAMANSNAGFADTITFDPILFSTAQTITLAMGELLITDSLIIDASGLGVNVTIDGNNASRVLNVSSLSGDLTLNNLTIQNGRTTANGLAGRGGGINFESSGILSLTGSLVTGNRTQGFYSSGGPTGGGISSTGPVILTDSVVSGNSTLDGGGGGIYAGNYGSSGTFTVTLNNSTVSGNSAAGNSSHGGGIHASTVTLNNSTVSGNSIAGDDSHGGGILASNAIINSSTITGNSTAGDSSQGGGIRALTVTLNNSTVSGNSTAGDDSDGGGILAPNAIINSSTITGNSTAGGNSEGGGILASNAIINSSTITGNSTAGGNSEGGGIFIAYALTLQNSIVAGNTAVAGQPDIRVLLGPDVDYSLIGDTSGTSINGNTGTGNILNIPANLGPLQDNGGTTLTHALLFGSLAVNAGDPAAVAGTGNTPSFDQRGTGFDRVKDGRIDIGAFEFALNFSLPIVVSTTSDVVNSDLGSTDLSLREAILIANYLIGADTITFDSGLFSSAQTINITSQLPTITDAVTITGLGADLLTIDAGGGADNTIGNGDGFGIFKLDDSISANRIDVSLSGLTLTGGDTAFNGGAVDNISERLMLNEVVINGNSATAGGGVNNFNGELVVTNSTFSNNQSTSTSGVGGGAIFTQGGTTISSSTFFGNTANNGGAIDNASNGFITLTNSTISGNTATNRGGGLVSGRNTTINNSTIVDNSASDGGGIYATFNALALNISNSIVANNSAGGDLGGTGPINVSYSLIGNTSGAPFNDNGGNILNVAPNLGPLQDNGGSTLTHALLVGSPAIDAGDPNAVPGQNNLPDFDQRGTPFGRVRGLRLDIGAFEDQANAAPLFTSPAGPSVPENVQAVHTLTVQDDPTQTIDYRILGLTPAGDLGPGQSLLAEQSIQSADGSHTLLFQADGNFVVYGPSGPVWGSDTSGTGANIASMQTDGNLVILDGATPVFATGTELNPLSRLHLANDGTPMVLRIDGAILWQGTLGDLFGGGTNFTPPALGSSFAEGADNRLFEITGGDQLQFIAAPDFENPGDANGDNIYEVSVLADDGNGGVTPQTILVTVTGINDNNPIFTSPDTADVVENTQSVVTLAASDADLPAQSITFSINGSGADNGAFEIVAGNQLQFIAAPDFENPADSDGDNVYEVSLLADDGNGGVTPQTILVTVTDVNDLPVFTSPDTANVVENTQSVVTLTATDADLPAQTITFSIDGSGADDGEFELAGGNELQFIAAPDFENPTNSGADGIYEVVVRADDGAGGVTLQTILVTVTDVAESMTYVVDITADENDGDFSAGDLSLREAIFLANTNLGADTITFATGVGETFENGGTLRLTGGVLTVSSDVTIDASAAPFIIVTADAAGDDLTTTDPQGHLITDALNNTNIGDNSRVFNVTAGSSSILGLVITGGVAADAGGIDVASGATLSISGSSISGNTANGGSTSEAGGIRNAGTLNLIETTVSGNNSSSGIGGLSNTTVGSVTLDSTTISGNRGSFAGGITADGSLSAVNTTISGNEATFGAGGILSPTGSTLDLAGVTITGNSGVFTGGIHLLGGLTLTNSIVAGNIASGSASDITDLGQLTVNHSLIGDNAGTSLTESQTADANGNLIGSSVGGGIINPMLGALADNGGPTLTHALLVGSPAIDAGDPAAVAGQGNTSLFDQRGSGRVDQGRIDIGSFEVQVAPQVESVVIQDGSGQRSVIRSVTVNFDSIITADAGAFILTTSGGQTVDVSAALSIVNGKTVAVLTFSGAFADATGSLIDGNYSLQVVDTMIHDLAGNAADSDGDGTSGDDLTDDFFRLYGDADGDGSVGFFDLALFRSALFAMEGDKNFNIAFDANGDGVVNLLDIQAFRDNFGTSIGK